MITAAKLTRTALELDIPADVFQEVANNLRTINSKIITAFVDSNERTEWRNAGEVQAAHDSFRRAHLEVLLAGLDA